MKRTLIVIVLFATLLLAVSPSFAVDKPIQIALFSPVQVFGEDQSITGLRFSLIYGKNENVTGLDVGLATDASGGFAGIQIGLLNFIRHDGFLPFFPIVNGSFKNSR